MVSIHSNETLSKTSMVPIAHRFMCLNAWSMGSGTIRRCGLVGVDAAFLEEVCHCGGGL